MVEDFTPNLNAANQAFQTFVDRIPKPHPLLQCMTPTLMG